MREGRDRALRRRPLALTGPVFGEGLTGGRRVSRDARGLSCAAFCPEGGDSTHQNSFENRVAPYRGLTIAEAKSAADSGDPERALKVMMGIDIFESGVELIGTAAEVKVKKHLDALGVSGEARKAAVDEIEE